jgi:hypothetical protein
MTMPSFTVATHSFLLFLLHTSSFMFLLHHTNKCHYVLVLAHAPTVVFLHYP